MKKLFDEGLKVTVKFEKTDDNQTII